MYNIYSRGVSEALYQGIQRIQNTGVEVETRNGKALEFPMPVCTEYSHSWEIIIAMTVLPFMVRTDIVGGSISV